MSTRVSIGKAENFPAGQLVKVTAENTSLVVARLGDKLCAVQNRCPHINLPIAGGKLEGNTITCPWHGSQFDMCSGENLDWVRGIAAIKLPNWSRKVIALGKKPQGIKTYPVVEENGELFVEIG